MKYFTTALTKYKTLPIVVKASFWFLLCSTSQNTMRKVKSEPQNVLADTCVFEGTLLNH